MTNKVLFNMLSLFLVLSSGTFFAILFGTQINITLLFLFFCVIIRTKIRFDVKSIFIILFMCMLLSVSYLLNLEHFQFDYFPYTFFILKLIAFSILTNKNKNEREYIFECVFNCIFVFSCISLSLYFCKLIFGDIFIPLIQVGEVNTHLFNTFYGVDFTDFGVFRNSSIYYEPGLYGVFLCLSLLWFLRNDKRNNIIIFILFVNLIFTLSPVAIFIGCIILCQKIHSNKMQYMIAIAMLFSIYLSLDFMHAKLASLSFKLRWSDVFIGFDLFLEQPMFGYGIFNENIAMQKNKELLGLSRGVSNGLVSLLYQTGVLFFIVYTYLLIRGLSLLMNIKMPLSIAVMILLLSQQPVHFSNIFIFIFIFGISNKCINIK